MNTLNVSSGISAFSCPTYTKDRTTRQNLKMSLTPLPIMKTIRPKLNMHDMFKNAFDTSFDDDRTGLFRPISSNDEQTSTTYDSLTNNRSRSLPTRLYAKKACNHK